MVLVHLNDNVTLEVDTDFENMRDAYQRALDNNQLLEITDAHGVTRAVNPRQIVFFEAQNGTHQTHPGTAEHQVPA